MRGNDICENRVSKSLEIYNQTKTTDLKTRAPAYFFREFAHLLAKMQLFDVFPTAESRQTFTSPLVRQNPIVQALFGEFSYDL